MNTFKHVLNTWLLSLVFHPFVFYFSMLAISDEIPLETLPILLVAGPIAGIPSLLLSWLFLNWLQNSHKGNVLLLVLWLLLAPAAIVINVFILLFLAGVQDSILDHSVYILPAFVSSWIAILMRIQQFQYLLTFKSADNENSLV